MGLLIAGEADQVKSFACEEGHKPKESDDVCLVILHCDTLSCIDISPPPVQLYQVARPTAKSCQLLLKERLQGVREAIPGGADDVHRDGR